MAIQTVKVLIQLILNPFAVTHPFFVDVDEEFDIDDDGWVDYHSDPQVGNVEVVVVPP